MIKYSEKIQKALRRIPPQWRFTVDWAITEAVRDAINVSSDSCICAALLTLIEDFGFGTSETATKIPKFIASVQSRIDTSADKYDDAMADGLRVKLEKYGVYYKR